MVHSESISKVPWRKRTALDLTNGPPKFNSDSGSNIHSSSAHQPESRYNPRIDTIPDPALPKWDMRGPGEITQDANLCKYTLIDNSRIGIRLAFY
jgi:hypothetical protein